MFPPGATLGAIVIPIIDDEVAEPPEFFRVDLSPGEDVTLTTSLATVNINDNDGQYNHLNLYIMYYRCLLYTSPSPRDATLSRMPSSA